MFRWYLTNWMRRSRGAPPADRPVHVGEYQRLHAYLSGRYASRVVLRLSEIQDLLGSALPAAAWHEPEWWDTPASPSAQSAAWTLAGRAAVVNLAAKTVVFERQP